MNSDSLNKKNCTLRESNLGDRDKSVQDLPSVRTPEFSSYSNHKHRAFSRAQYFTRKSIVHD